MKSFNELSSFFGKIYEFYNDLKIIISFFVCFLFIMKANCLVRSFSDILKFLYYITKKMLQNILSKSLKVIVFEKKDVSVVRFSEQNTISAITKKRKLYKLIETYSTIDEAFNRMKMELDGQLYNFRLNYIKVIKTKCWNWNRYFRYSKSFIFETLP
jgi:hypothetical protein